MQKILELKFGSHLYGTDTPESDLDLKAIHLPSAREIILGNVKQTINLSRKKADCERNTKDDIDIESFSLCRYLDLLMEGQTVALDILFAPTNMYTQNSTSLGVGLLWTIYENRDKLLTRNVNAFVGYARQQAAKYGIKGSRMDSLKRVKELLDTLPLWDKLLEHESSILKLVEDTKELISLEKTPLIEVALLKGPKGLMDAPHLRVNGRAIPFHARVKMAREIVGKMYEGYGNRAHKAHLAGGVDWKALSHAVRVNGEAMELLETSKISFPRPDKELLVKIKKGEIEDQKVYEMIEQGLADLYAAHEKSPLRETPDRQWAEDLVYDVYKDIVKNS